MIFLAVGRILVFVAAFFCQISNYTHVLKTVFLLLLAGSWFWWPVFSIEILIKRIEILIFPAFGRSLADGAIASFG